MCLLPGWSFLHVLSNEGGVGHAHQSVGQRNYRQEVLRGDGPWHTVRALPHDVRQSQLQTRRQGQLLQQGLLGKQRQTNEAGTQEIPVCGEVILENFSIWKAFSSDRPDALCSVAFVGVLWFVLTGEVLYDTSIKVLHKRQSLTDTVFTDMFEELWFSKLFLLKVRA